VRHPHSVIIVCDRGPPPLGRPNQTAADIQLSAWSGKMSQTGL